MINILGGITILWVALINIVGGIAMLISSLHCNIVGGMVGGIDPLMKKLSIENCQGTGCSIFHNIGL